MESNPVIFFPSSVIPPDVLCGEWLFKDMGNAITSGSEDDHDLICLLVIFHRTNLYECNCPDWCCFCCRPCCSNAIMDICYGSGMMAECIAQVMDGVVEVD